jgi:hypothetical protein
MHCTVGCGGGRGAHLQEAGAPRSGGGSAAAHKDACAAPLEPAIWSALRVVSRPGRVLLL